MRTLFIWLVVGCMTGMAQAGPVRTLVSEGSQGFEVEVAFPRPTFEEQTLDAGTFSRVAMEGMIFDGSPGEPWLPSYGLPFAVPSGTRAEVSVQVLKSEVFRQVQPLPVPHTTFEGDRLMPTAIASYQPDLALYGSGSWYPPQAHQVTPVDEWRFHRVQSVVLRPLRVHLARQEYEWIERARVTVRFLPAQDGPRPSPAPPAGEAWESLASHLLVNGATASGFRSRSTGLISLSAAAEAPSPGARIQVAASGLARIAFSDLEDAGFPQNTPVDDVRLEERGFNHTQIAGNPYGVNNLPRTIEDANDNGLFDAGDYLLFYAASYEDRFTPLERDRRYSRFHVYWLTAEGGGEEFEVLPDEGLSPTTTPNSFRSTVRAEEDVVYTNVPTETGGDFYPTGTTLFWRGASSPPLNAKMDTPDPDPNGTVSFTGFWRGNFLSALQKVHYESVVFNGQTLVDRHAFTGVNDFRWNSSPYANSLLNNGSNSFQAIGEYFWNSEYSYGSGAYFDFLEATYDRLLIAFEDALHFNSEGYTGIAEFSVSGFSSSNIWVFDVTQPQSPVRLEAEIVEDGGSYTAVITRPVSGPVRSYYAVVPESVSGLPETPHALSPDLEHLGVLGWGATRDLAEEGRDSDMVIVTHTLFREPMERLADHRRSQGLSVVVCDVHEVYDQFSGGHKTPEAIKSFLRMAYQTWDVPPTYLLLGADGNEDYRNDTNLSAVDWVPTMMISANVPGSLSIREVAGTDPWYGQGLEVGEGISTIAPDVFVGRLTVNSQEEADRVVNKIIHYETGDPQAPWRNRGVFQADDQYSEGIVYNSPYCWQSGEHTFKTTTVEILNRIVDDGGYDQFNAVPFLQADYMDTVAELGRNPVPGNCPNRVQNLTWVRNNLADVLLEVLDEGGLVWAYTGHANASLITSESIMHVLDQVPKLNNLGSPYTFMGFACHLNEFERARERQSRSFAEVLLDLENRGAVATFASTGFEWLHTNGSSQLATTAPMFWDVPRDPVTGRQRRHLGEMFFVGLYNLFLSAPGTDHFHLSRTYTLLGDPATRMDMTAPALRVELNGSPVESGSALLADAFGDTLSFLASIAEDVDLNTVRITRGGVQAQESEFTLTRLTEGAPGQQEFSLAYKTSVAFGNSDIVIETTDWTGFASRFEMPGRIEVKFLADGKVIVPGGDNEVETDTPVEIRVTSPAPLTVESFLVTVDGAEVGAQPVKQDEAGRSWSIPVPAAWGDGPNDVGVTLREGEETLFQSITVTVPTDELDLVKDSVAFYPNPLEEGSGTLMYRLTNSAERVELHVYSVRGRKVLFEVLEGKPGWNYFAWDGTDELGDPVANGVYIALLKVEDAIRHKERLVVSR